MKVRIMPPAARVLLRGSAALCVSTLLALNGCGSSSSQTVAPTPPTSTLDVYNTGVTVVNTTSKCAWVTVFWANSDISPWHVLDDGPAGPRFVDAGKSHVFGYFLVPKVPVIGTLQIKVLAEVKEGPGCNQKNLAYKYDVNKGMRPLDGDADVCAHIVDTSPGEYNVTKPELRRNC
jgi:hypothetical protein